MNDQYYSRGYFTAEGTYIPVEKEHFSMDDIKNLMDYRNQEVGVVKPEATKLTGTDINTRTDFHTPETVQQSYERRQAKLNDEQKERERNNPNTSINAREQPMSADIISLYDKTKTLPSQASSSASYAQAEVPQKQQEVILPSAQVAPAPIVKKEECTIL